MKNVAVTENHLYNKTYAKGKRFFGKYVRVYVLKDLKAKKIMLANPKKEYVNRLGISVSKKNGGAVTRNRIKRIIRDCNDEQFLKSDNPKVLLPHFSCHTLRHTFTTRMCEAGVNVKVIQDALGHTDVSTTLNIYTDVTKELKRVEFEGLDRFFKEA